MADLPQFPHVLQNGPGNLPDADEVMANYQHIRSHLNSNQQEPSDLASGAAGQIIVCNASGVPQYVTASGDVTVDAAGEFSLSDALAAELGVNGADIRRGKSIIATEESRSSSSYGTLTTPDEVADVVLPSDGLIAVAYQALWKESVAGAARAAIFIGANQLQITRPTVIGPVTQAAATGAAGHTNQYGTLFSSGAGLLSAAKVEAGEHSLVTTGQVVGAARGSGETGEIACELGGTVVENNTDFQASGGFCYVFAAAGTYTIGVRFKASSGSVTAKERKLWVRTMGF